MKGNMWNGLVRRMDQARIAGVCAGLAVHYGWKLSGVRIAMFALCAFLPPLGFGLYLAGALLLPAVEADGSYRPAMLGGFFSCSNRKQFAGAGLWEGSMVGAVPPPPPPATGASTNWTVPGHVAQVSDAGERVRDLEQRLRDIEAYMTSSRYEFDRELRDSR